MVMAVGNVGGGSPVRQIPHSRAARSRDYSRFYKIARVIGGSYTVLLAILAKGVWEGINEEIQMDRRDPYTSCVASYQINGFFPPDPYGVHHNEITKACGSGNIKWRNASVKVSQVVRTTCRPWPTKENG